VLKKKKIRVAPCLKSAAESHYRRTPTTDYSAYYVYALKKKLE
jgi:hypothetical protein